MSANSKIEWTDHTFNPWIGCAKVSPGCAHCYAEALDARWRGGTHWGKGAPRMRTSAANWRTPLKWNRDASEGHASACPGREESRPSARRPRVFCASLADWLDDEVPIEWLADLLALIHATPNLDWQLLTKRPENFGGRFEAAFRCTQLSEATRGWMLEWSDEIAPANVWIGTSVEDQARADERIPHLLSIPARVRFLSCEPLLGPVDVEENLEDQLDGGYVLGSAPIHWVICGGESGPKARPMNPDWARGLRDQCSGTDSAFFFKQWGQWAPSPADIDPESEPWCDTYVGEFHREREDGVALPFVEGCMCDDGTARVYRLGKKAAGRLLDGREWSEFPQSAETADAPTRP